MELPLVTNRLALRWPIDSDFEALCELWCDPRVARFMDDWGPRDVPGVRAWLDHLQNPSSRDGTHLQLILTRRTDQTPVGWLGLGVSNDPTGDWSFGYAVHPAHRAHGYATEALAAAIPNLAVNTIWGECHHDNATSAHVMQSAGMTEIAPTPHQPPLPPHPPGRRADRRTQPPQVS
ncbi:GNAT family N-acetyltransferase [Kribbella sp. NPDC048915]|uniref:GNAT family N-acetyltransferase n=1 Tax=Kribbella sp. NPDC048915 TaxID=3155148 RepID=UPI0033C0A75D